MPRGGPGFDRLAEGLVEAQERQDLARTVALLWTWLEFYLLELGSLREKPPALRAAALGEEPFRFVDDKTLDSLRANPIRNAAVLLARIGFSFEEGEHDEQLGRRPVVATEGIDGTTVVLAVRRPLLGGDDDDDVPPEAIEHPSLSTLAPRLLVSPLTVDHVELSVVRPEGEQWEAVISSLEQGIAHRADETGDDQRPKASGPTLEVHLDPLRTHGLTGLRRDEELDVGWFDEDEITSADEQACIEAAEAAIDAASGTPSILVLPELAASPPVVAAISKALKDRSDPPALTVVGLYHEEAADPPVVDEKLVDPASLARRVNEAVVFGPFGEELWRHRKLTCAQAHSQAAKDRGEPPLVEDIRLGDTLRLVSTPIGTIAVTICLDSFAANVRNRISASPADVLLVPSLSPEVKRHRDSLQHLVQKQWGIAFVCNRAPSEKGKSPTDEQWTGEENRSFWACQRQDLSLPPVPGAKEHPSFVFKLAEHS